VIRKFSALSVALGISIGADFCLAQEAATSKAEGMILLDYQVIPVPGNPSIDLMGFHFLSRMNDWMYLGVGGYAPLFKGEYGGFMALDITAHFQRKIFGDLFADAGLSIGGGGGGKSVEQSKILSGTGGYVKSYIGLGYDFNGFSAGVNFAKMKFKDSAINKSGLNIQLQVPFSYATGSYASSGERDAARGALEDASENTLTMGLDRIVQIDPEGLNKDPIGMADLQFSHFMTKNSYWFINAGVGYRGLPLYNQVLAGLGHRLPISPRINLYGQLAVGSGGYAPETINTGPGLLVYPKVSVEYLFDKNFGFSISSGYLFAPKGSSKNYTLGASLNYHIHSGGRSSDQNILYRGYRVSLFPQTEFNVKSEGKDQNKINMLSVQLDNLVSNHVYIPVQVSIAYNAYLGYPGYGELLAGVGVQTKHHKDSRTQAFGQLLLGTNSHGPILKTGIGLNFGLSDRFAIYGLVGQTLAVGKEKFRSDYLGFGLTYRFSVPSW